MSFKMNEHHWMVLIDFMESHLSFARGQFSGPTGKITQKKLWVELTQKLNSLGYGEKTTEKWQKTWADIKYLLKKKASLIKRDISMTGGGAGSQSKLNAYEERIVGILGKSFVEGVGSTECGLIITECLPKKTSCMMSSAIKLQEGQIPSTITEGLISHDLPKLVPSATVVHEEAATVIDQNHDHLYYNKPKRKRTAEEVEKKLYKETIEELREIKRGVSSISDHMMTISETLKDIRNILNRNQ